jgi:hypothetical protein
MKRLLTAFGSSLLIAAGAAHATMIGISPLTESNVDGSSVQVDLDITGVNSGTTPALAAWDINVNFDPSILSFSSASFGTGVNVSGLGDIQSSSSLANGTTELYELSLDSTDLLTSLQPQNFTLATLNFSALAAGTSYLDVTINSLSDGNGNAIPATVAPGSITIAPVPLPQSWLLMVGGFLILMLVAPRKQPSAFRK